MTPSRHHLWAAAGFAILCSSSFAQETKVDLRGAPKAVTIVSDAEFRHRLGTARASRAIQTTAPSAAGHATPRLDAHVAYYSSLGAEKLPFYMVGSNPSEGGGTTIIPVVIIPLKFVFSTGEVLDGSQVTDAAVNSPIFQKTSFQSGTIDLGVTQYGDALMRAQFWNLRGFSRDRYHVLLGTPSIAPTVTIPIDVSQGQGFVSTFNGDPTGFVDGFLLDDLLRQLTATYTPDILPIFWGRDIIPTFDGAGAFGYHDALLSDPSSQTYIFTGYSEHVAYAPTHVDMVTLSHEVAEWMNDPFPLHSATDKAASNFAPPAFEAGGINYILEVGDPLNDSFAKVLNGTSYDVQDVVNPWWYLHTTPSPAANGWYSFQNAAGLLPLAINSPASIAGSYTDTAQMSWAPVTALVTGNVVYVGRGCPAGSIDGSNPDDPYLADPNGAVALIDRGNCNVSLKIDRATRAGAIAVLIGDNRTEPPPSFGFGGGTQFAPSLSISKTLSDMIKSVLGSAAVSVTIDPKRRLPIPFSTLGNAGPGAIFPVAQGVPLNCNDDFSICYVPKNVLVVLPFAVIAGDAVVQDANSTEATAVFRVNTDAFNTARGTGGGATVFLYSSDGTAGLPNPSTYSANAQYVSAASGPTSYIASVGGFPNVYQLDLGAAPVAVRYTGATMAGSSASVQLSAVVTSSGNPVSSGSVYFSLGTQTCNAPTDATGKAVCSIVLQQHPGRYDIAAAFGGVFGTYAGGSDTESFIVTGE